MNNVMNIHNDNKVMYMIALAVGISNISSRIQNYYVMFVVTKMCIRDLWIHLNRLYFQSKRRRGKKAIAKKPD